MIPHSIRVGTCVRIQKKDVDSNFIQISLRWCSLAFMLYLRNVAKLTTLQSKLIDNANNNNYKKLISFKKDFMCLPLIIYNFTCLSPLIIQTITLGFSFRQITHHDYLLVDDILKTIHSKTLFNIGLLYFIVLQRIIKLNSQVTRHITPPFSYVSRLIFIYLKNYEPKMLF